MQMTIANQIALFNVKNIVYNTSLDNLAEGQFAIVPAGSTVSIADTVRWATLPDAFMLFNKINGGIIKSPELIYKAGIVQKSKVVKVYQPEVTEVWEGITPQTCDCSKEILLKIYLQEDKITRRDGATWTSADTVYSVSPKALSCGCNCAGTGVYDNHLLTRELYRQMLASPSDFYSVSVISEATGAAAFADLAAVDTFIAANKAINTDADTTNDSPKLKLVLTGKPQGGKIHHDIEVKYTYPRGALLQPFYIVDGGLASLPFTKTRSLVFENGAGFDMREEEMRNMSYYTNLNHHFQLIDGTQDSNLTYQFENGKNYDVVNFEYDTDKVMQAGSADKKRMGILLGAETGSAVSTQLQGLFMQ